MRWTHCPFPRILASVLVNGIISKLHDGKRVFYLNINDALLKTQGAIADRVGHLTEKGCEVWAEKMRPTLKELLREPAP
ncbi:MAG: hypothetical protein FJ291_24615 [Planctomycetes bacterium]|nr:hypothetical protein [Planctomycetota bacterium]